MKYYGLDMEGKFFGENVPTLPSFSSESQGRLIYVEDEDMYYYASASGWYQVGGVDPAEITAHIDSNSAHAAVSTATADRMIIRDSNGRAKVASPSSSSDIARKLEIDTEAASRASADGSLQTQINNEITARQSADNSHASLVGTSIHGMTVSNTASRGVVRDGSGDIFTRLFRPEYTSGASNCNYFMGQVTPGSGTDNYMRPVTKNTTRNKIFYTSSLAYSGGWNGYVQLTAGVYLQWGYKQMTANSTSYITLPVTYPNIHLRAWASRHSYSSTTGAATAHAYSNTYIRLSNGSSSTLYIRWMSIGY